MFGSTCELSTDPEFWRQRSTRINIETCVVSQRRAPVCQCVASLPIARRQDGGRLCDFRCTRGWSCLVTVPGPSRPATQATAPKRRGQWLRKPDVRDLHKTARRNSSRCLVRGSHLPQRAALAPCSPSAVEPVGVPFRESGLVRAMSDRTAQIPFRALQSRGGGRELRYWPRTTLASAESNTCEDSEAQSTRVSTLATVLFTAG